MKQGLLIRSVDREDLWVKGVVIPISDTSNYRNSFNEIRELLLEDDIIEVIKNRFYLKEVLFNGDEYFTLTSVEYFYARIKFIFVNDRQERKELVLGLDYVDIITQSTP